MNYFVGLWPILSHFTIGIGITAACIAAALLTTEIADIPIVGPFLAPLTAQIRTWAIVCAVGSVVGLVGYSMGVKNESDRCKAQFEAAQKAAVQTSVRARTRAERDDTSGVCDPRDTDCQH